MFLLKLVATDFKASTDFRQASSGPGADHPQFLSTIFIRNLHPPFLTNVMSFLKKVILVLNFMSYVFS